MLKNDVQLSIVDYIHNSEIERNTKILRKINLRMKSYTYEIEISFRICQQRFAWIKKQQRNMKNTNTIFFTNLYIFLMKILCEYEFLHSK